MSLLLKSWQICMHCFFVVVIVVIFCFYGHVRLWNYPIASTKTKLPTCCFDESTHQLLAKKQNIINIKLIH